MFGFSKKEKMMKKYAKVQHMQKLARYHMGTKRGGRRLHRVSKGQGF